MNRPPARSRTGALIEGKAGVAYLAARCAELPAEFMVANNTFSGLVTDVAGDSARIEGNGWALRGRLRSPLKAGDRATAVVRLEKIKLAQTPKENSLRLPLTTSVYLGNTWEYVFDLGGATVRGYGNEFMHPGEQLVDIPAEHLWLF